MIFTLVRELRRSQGRYARAAFGLVLLAVALASFAMVSIGTRAARRLLERIRQPTSEVIDEKIETILIQRGSTAAPRS